MSNPTISVVAYFRVSTARQKESGLGLDGQRAAVAEYARAHGATVVQEYREAESGKWKDRPLLAKAIGHAKLAKATLVVAKLDRLARNVAFLSALMESEVDFVACDNPHANKLTIHILAAVAENEAHQISERTKAALAAAKRRGIKLGSARPGHWKGREHRRLAGGLKGLRAAALARSAKAREEYAFLLPRIKEMRHAGSSLQGIANQLNADGHATRAGKPWTPTAVWRVLRG
jgi:DNA invertase Pin-like site-specific DNA recombinase